MFYTLIALCPLVVIVLVLIWKQVRNQRHINEILQIANQPSQGLVSKKFLAVVSPRSDATPDQRKVIAAALRAWLSHDYAKKVHGLEQLEAGEHPIVVAPHCIEPFKVLSPERIKELDPADCYWHLALLEVEEDIDLDLALRELDKDLSKIVDLLGFTADPSAYDAARM